MDSSRRSVVETLERTGVIAVVRLDRPADLTKLAAALADGGVVMVEITMTVPGALQSIASAVRELDGRALIGAGTVLDAATAEDVVAAGAAFVVSPCFDAEVVEAAHRHDVAVIPGCLTPSEIRQAVRAGADAVKLFPGRVATPGYFSDLRGPFPGVKMLPTGNVDLVTAPEYIRAGAVAVGVGKALVDVRALRQGSWDEITKKARSFRAVVDEARTGSHA